MSVTLLSPPYSFVQLENPGQIGCVHPVPLCLPAESPGDFNFQIIANITGDDKLWFQNTDEADITYTIMARVCTDCTDIHITDHDIPHSFSWQAVWRRVTEGATDVWIGNFGYTGYDGPFADLENGQCFQICFHKVGISGENEIANATMTKITCTDTCFIKTSYEYCFTSFFSYYCRENAFGFYYTDADGTVNFENSVRLPCYLRNMQLPSEEKSYVRSDGTKIKLYERVEEEYELVVDHIYHTWHKYLKVLLAHDKISVRNLYQTGLSTWAINCREKYEIEWPGMPGPVAPAKTKVVRSAALTLINSNCK